MVPGIKDTALLSGPEIVLDKVGNDLASDVTDAFGVAVA